MHTVHAGYSIIAKLKKDKIDSARLFLTEINKNPGRNSKIPFDNSPSTHFVTGVVLPEQDYLDKKLPATLLLATSFSGPAKKHLDELMEIGAPALRELFQNCEDFPVSAQDPDKALRKFLEKHRHWDTFYTGMQYLTRQDIVRENELRILIGNYIDKIKNDGSFKKGDEKKIRQQIQDHVREQPGFEWTKKPWKKSFLDFFVLNRSLLLAGIIALFLILSPIGWLIFHHTVFKIATGILLLIVLFFIFLILSIRSYEKEDQYVASRPTDETVKRIANSQIYPVFNNMSVSGGLKKGLLRPLFFKIALRAVILVRGYMSIPTVFTARWMALDKGKRLVFISNFMNRSESYVRDFIDNKRGARTINLIFGQGYGYPVTKWIMHDGAIDNPNAFINEVMSNHHITDFWYCPYQHLSIDNINNNRKISRGLFAGLSDEQTINWLQLF